MSLEPKCKSKSNISVASSSLSSTLHNQEVLRCVCVVGLSPLRGGHMERAPEIINNGRFFFVVLNVKIKIMTKISSSKNIYCCWLIFKMSFINPLKDTIFRVCFIKYAITVSTICLLSVWLGCLHSGVNTGTELQKISTIGIKEGDFGWLGLG